jgi:hypothetical protein
MADRQLVEEEFLVFSCKPPVPEKTKMTAGSASV